MESPARLSDVRLLPLLAVIQPQPLPPPASDPAAVEREVTPASRGEENFHVSLSSSAVLLQNVNRLVREP